MTSVVTGTATVPLTGVVPSVTVTATTGVDVAFGEFLEFETLTLCPIDTRCIDASLLREDEIAWLDAYHATVRERLAPRLSGAALEWLNERAAPMRMPAA